MSIANPIQSWLNRRSLRWRFSVAPSVGIVLMIALTVLYIRFADTQNADFRRVQIQTVALADELTQLANRLARNHTKIHELLLFVEKNADEGTLFQSSRPVLFEIHDVEAELRNRLASVPPQAFEAELLAKLIGQVAQYRVTASNALAMATVDFDLAKRVIRDSTNLYNSLIVSFAAAHHAFSTHLREQLEVYQDRARQNSRLFTLLFVITIAVTAVLAILLSNFLSREINALISRLGGAVSSEPDKAPAAKTANEVEVLSVALDELKKS